MRSTLEGSLGFAPESKSMISRAVLGSILYDLDRRDSIRNPYEVTRKREDSLLINSHVTLAWYTRSQSQLHVVCSCSSLVSDWRISLLELPLRLIMVAITVPENYGWDQTCHSGYQEIRESDHRILTVPSSALPWVVFPSSASSTASSWPDSVKKPKCRILIATRLLRSAGLMCAIPSLRHGSMARLSWFKQAKAEQFNCAQRAHSNFLENASQTMFFTLVAGLKYPQLATGLGAAWLVFRSLFLYGYHSCVVGNKGRGRSSGHDVKEYWLIKQTRDSESPNRSPSLKMLSCSFASLTYRIGEALMISSAFSLINSRHTFSIPFPKADIATMHTAGWELMIP